MRAWKLFLTVISLSLPLIANAAVTEWQILPESEITFVGTQNGAPTTGNFKKFSGTIQFDPKKLQESHIKIVVDMNSVASSYTDLTSTLLTDDWFNTKMFPQATFVADSFVKTGENQYQAKGTLTIRDKTLPVTLTFQTKELSKTKTEATGSTTLKRTQFGVGVGEWADTDAVKDDVQVNFKISAQAK